MFGSLKAINIRTGRRCVYMVEQMNINFHNAGSEKKTEVHVIGTDICMPRG